MDKALPETVCNSDYLQKRLLVVISKGVVGGGRLNLLVNRRNLVKHFIIDIVLDPLLWKY